MLEMLRSKVGKLIISGHRGASGYAPENTLAAFQKALAVGADIIEFDVHLSRDKQCVILHDELLDRTTNGHGLVWEQDWADLKKLDAGGWFDRWAEASRVARATLPPGSNTLPLPDREYAGTRLPLLEEVLEWARAVRMPVSIEIKAPWPFYYGSNVYPDIVERVLDRVAQVGDEEMTVIHSFDHRAVLRVKQLNPNITTVVSFSGAILVDPLQPVRAAQANGLAIGSQWVTPELVQAAHAEDINVFGWGLGEDPFNQAHDLNRLAAMGVDYLSGGFPDLLRGVIENSLAKV